MSFNVQSGEEIIFTYLFFTGFIRSYSFRNFKYPKILILNSVSDPDRGGKKAKEKVGTGLLGEYIAGRIKVRILL